MIVFNLCLIYFKCYKTKKKKIAVLYLKWITNKDLLNSKWNSAQCYVAAGMGGVFGGEWIHVYVWLSSFTVHS